MKVLLLVSVIALAAECDGTREHVVETREKQMPYADIFTPELPWTSGSDTSHEAAVQAKDFVGPQGEAVLAWFRSRRDGTQKEAAAALGMGRASICARVRALEMAGALVKTTTKLECSMRTLKAEQQRR